MIWPQQTRHGLKFAHIYSASFQLQDAYKIQQICYKLFNSNSVEDRGKTLAEGTLTEADSTRWVPSKQAQIKKYLSPPCCDEELAFRNLDVVSIAFLLRKCGNEKDLILGKRIHDRVIKTALNSNRFLRNVAIQMYSKCGALREARELFANTVEPNIQSWNSLINAHLQKGQLKQARELFEHIPEKDVILWTKIIAAYARSGQLHDARQLFDKIPQRDTVAWTTMITAYAQGGHLNEAIELFHAMPQHDLVSMTAMITAYAQHGCIGEALKIFQQMPEHDIAAWNAIMVAYGQLGRLKEAFDIFQQMPQRNIVSWTTMVTAFAQFGEMQNALLLFRKMPECNLVSWNAMISGCGQYGQVNEVFQLFQQMLQDGVKPDKVTLINIVDACARNAALSRGKHIHAWIMNYQLEPNEAVEITLMNMYAKCGCLQDACMIFDKLFHRGIFSWTAISSAYAQHGYARETLRLIQQMLSEGQILDEFNICSILSACGHGGLVNEGCHYFTSMIGHHEVAHVLEHYNCIIDLLARTYWLNEAEALIGNMPMPPDSASWTSMLASCKIHDMRRGIRAAKQLAELEPGNAAPYVLLGKTSSLVDQDEHHLF